jgi:hypothetical protein
MNIVWKPIVVILSLVGLVALMPLAAGCSSDKLNRQQGGAGTIWGSVDYEGSKVVQKVGVAVFDSPTFPPVTAPVTAISLQKEAVLTGVDFPLDYKVEGLAPGQYWLVIFGDTDVAEGYHMPSGDDPATGMVGPLVVPLDETGLRHDVILQDGAWNLPEEDTLPGDGSTLDALEGDLALDLVEADLVPAEGKAALFGTISYEGELRGRVYIVGFPDPEPSMPSIYFAYDNPGTFPFEYQQLEVKPGTYYMMSYINIAPPGMGVEEGDPRSSDIVEVKLVEGQVKRVDFLLEDQ